MDIYTHLYIAKKLYGKLSKNTLIDINAFSYGNIKPDIPSKNKKSHTRENYLNFVLDQIAMLEKGRFTVREFSIKLGEICHYMSDFCCYYHLNEGIHNIDIKHFFYEFLMSIRLLTYDFDNNQSNVFTILETSTIENSFTSFFTTVFALYSKTSNSMKKDLDFAIFTSLYICEKVLDGVHFSSFCPADYDLKHSTNLQGGKIL